MNDSRPPEPKRCWYQFGLRTLPVLGLLVISGCGPSKGNKATDVDDEELVGLEIKEVGDATVARFTGDKVTLHRKNVEIVRGELLSLAEQEGRKEFILDFSEVQFVSEEAFGRLIALNKKIGQANGRLRLCSLHSNIHEVLVLTGLDGLFDIYDDADEALKAAAHTRQDVEMISAMSVEELSERWRKESLDYVAAMNACLLRGMQSGWDKAGQPPKETRRLLAGRVIDAVREANKMGELTDLRVRYPPAHSPFIEMLEENGQHLSSGKAFSEVLSTSVTGQRRGRRHLHVPAGHIDRNPSRSSSHSQRFPLTSPSHTWGRFQCSEQPSFHKQDMPASLYLDGQAASHRAPLTQSRRGEAGGS
jgi:anti-anti-sigma factor